MKHFLFWLLLLSAPLFPQEPVALYLTWQKDPQTTMTTCWVARGKISAEIEYQRSGEKTWKKAQGTQAPLPDKFGFTVSQVELQGLSPNTEYLFKLPGEVKTYKFKTLSNDPSQPLHFIIGGDVYHDDIAFVSAMNKQAAKLNPAFIVFGGDLCYNEVKKSSDPKTQNRWIDLLATWKSDLVTSDGRLIPIIPLIGNHDVSGRWGTHPRNAPHFYTFFPTQGYGAFDIGRYATLLLLDSGHTHAIDKGQKQWLEQNLQSRAQFPHKFAVYHVAAYPSIRHFDGGKKEEIRNHWVPLFEKYGIQFAFEHHDHAYKRTYPLLNGKIDPKGIIYVGDGCWGVEEPRKPKKGYKWYIAKGLPKRNLISVHLHQKERHLIVYDEKGEILDEIFSR